MGAGPVVTRKAESFKDDAIAAGWKAEIVDDGDRSTVIATRGDEEISISWLREACLNETTYRVADSVRKLRNASAARKRLDAAPGETPLAKSGRTIRVKSGSSVGKVHYKSGADPDPEEDEDLEYIVPRPRLPFDIELDGDEEILQAVVGKEITWKNSLSKGTSSARVMSNPRQKQLRMDRNRSGERCITFAAAGEGFRSVKLSAILSVTR